MIICPAPPKIGGYKLQQMGFQFRFPDVKSALRDLLK